MKALLSLVLCVLGVGVAPAQSSPAERAQPVAPSRGTLLQFDFNGESIWPQTPTAGVGTIDVAGGMTGSGGLLLVVDAAAPRGNRNVSLSSGPLAVRNTESNLGKLTLGFNLSASAVRPVKVRVESFNASKQRTGGLEAVIYPAAPDFHQRYAIDLSAMKPAGGGAFNPADPFVGFAFELSSTTGSTAATRHELRLDNVHYGRPAYYVSPNGKDTNNGHTEQTAWATPQKAVEMAVPGDIILLMDGTYGGGREIVDFRRGGTPAAWITLKNYPGHQPVLTSWAWSIIKVGRGSPRRPSSEAALAYLEVRGLRVRGNSDEVASKHGADIGKSKSTTNGNGISVDGRYETNKPHHVRIADNTVSQCSGAGVSVIQSDWATVENNHVHGNCKWMIYAGSGISIYQAVNFDAAAGAYRMLIRHNRTHANMCTQPWSAIGKVSDGNGIIIDDFRNTQNKSTNGVYQGRTLVQGNLSYRNGGSGVHAYLSNRVDIINNTAWMNSASPELQYAQIFAQDCDDVRIVNNILVAPVANVSAGEKPETINGAGRCKNVVYAHNLYFGGNKRPLMGENDRIADPLFVDPSTDPAKADFRLKPGSPALNAGRLESFSPITDLDGKLRPLNGSADLGAFEK